MTDNDSQPPWNAADKPNSLKAYAEFLHREAVRVFTRDKSHVHILFLFAEAGLVSVIRDIRGSLIFRQKAYGD